MRNRPLLERGSFAATLAVVLCVSGLAELSARAGGPLLVGGPAMGTDGQPIVWNPAAMPIGYRTDGGPLSTAPGGATVISNATGVARVQAMFQVWQDVPTATIAFGRLGGIQSTSGFTDGDVSTVAEFDAVVGTCNSGTQNPIMFDANGGLFNQLVGDPSVIGFAGVCTVNAGTGFIVSGLAMLNGPFQDGVQGSGNGELTTDGFDAAFIHEFGHFAGLDHSQLNAACMFFGLCDADRQIGLPTMFPFFVGDFQKSLAPDDLAWISMLYPETTDNAPSQVPFNTVYGRITGTIYFSDGVTPTQGVNVMVQDVNVPQQIGVSVVSGYRFSGNPGQAVVVVNPGTPFGSRSPALLGFYEVPVPAGTYTIGLESVAGAFSGGSSVGPLDPPISAPGPNERWNLAESATDVPADSNLVEVTPGAVLPNHNIILNETPPRFDQFEDTDSPSARLFWRPPEPARKGNRIAPAEFA